MKSFALVLSVLAFTSSAWASKARVGALQGAFDLRDVQTTFNNPAYIHSLGSLLTFEMGGTSATANPKAEGGFLMKKDGATWGAYLGHASAQQNALRAVGGTTYPKMENPVDLFYGKDNWAAGVSLSQSQDLTASTKQTTMSARFGLIMADASELAVNADLFAEATNASGTTDDSYHGAPIVSVDYQRELGDKWGLDVGVGYGDTKQDSSGASQKVKLTSATVGLIHRPMPEVYYGISGSFAEMDIEGAKTTNSTVPLFIGIEKDVLSWATFRGSIKQNFLLGESKTSTTQAKRNTNDTTVALGLGMKSNGFTLDGLIAGSTNGKVDGNNVLTTGSVTYNF